jgi:hypothetical protein
MNLTWLVKNWVSLKAWLTAPTLDLALNTFPINVAVDMLGGIKDICLQGAANLRKDVPFEEDVSISTKFLKASVESMLELGGIWLLLPLVTGLCTFLGVLWLNPLLMPLTWVFGMGWGVGIFCVGLLRHRKAFRKSPLLTACVSCLEYGAFLTVLFGGLVAGLVVISSSIFWFNLAGSEGWKVLNALGSYQGPDMIRVPLLFFAFWVLIVVTFLPPIWFWSKILTARQAAFFRG